MWQIDSVSKTETDDSITKNNNGLIFSNKSTLCPFCVVQIVAKASYNELIKYKEALKCYEHR